MRDVVASASEVADGRGRSPATSAKERVRSFAFGFANLPLGWWELLSRTAKEFVADNGLGLAAQLAYYFFFSLFPAVLVGIAFASFFPLEHFVDRMVATLGGVVPGDIIGIVQDQIRKISEGNNGGILTFGVAAALWSSSAALMGLIDALNRAYDIEEGRSWWKVRLLALGLTLALAAFIVIAFALVLVGPTAADYIARATGLGPVFAWTWKVLQWPLVLALVALGAAAVYYFAPDAEQEWVWVTPGAVLAAIIWLAASLGFKYYVTRFGTYTETYGTIGGVMVLLLWFYLSGVVFLVGAELNAEIEHASPYGKAEGEKVPGTKRAIGALAYRRYLTRPPPASRPTPPALLPPAPPAPAPGLFRRALIAAVAAVVVFRGHAR
jgi:membrane protein